MAVDEVLLEVAGAEQIAYLRFYRWSEPTLSLGYFQRYEDRAAHAPSAGCAAVRRLSGGGAILHDHEWTYSLALPVHSPLGKNAAATYDLVNEATLRTLALFGVDARRASEFPTPSGEPFLCFERRSAGDLVLGVAPAAKIMGSAQRRRQGAILQHGSLLLRRSRFAPELPGIADLTVNIDELALVAEWSNAVCRALALDAEPKALTAGQVRLVQERAIECFGNPVWTRRR